ncbi:MAG TPA: hypothetical protein PLF40_30915, partial [Kofleriaceae bacterium]|nr:hypothetical protein [Kofleriaceae bacterium]
MMSALSWLGSTSQAVLNQAAEVAHKAHSARPHSEADLVLPNFKAVTFFGISGWTILAMGLAVAALGIIFGMVIFSRLKNMPVHKSMLEISELIYETCKTYLKQQAKFIGILWVFIATVV